MILDKILFHLSLPRLRIIKSLFFNFKTLPFKYAIKMPILIYGPCKIYWLLGTVEIKSKDIHYGMIKLGKNNEFFNGIDGSSFIYIQKKGKIIFDGPCAISNNYKIKVGSNAVLHFGKNTFFGSGVKFVCSKEISIGDYTRCAYESQLVDTNSHFVFNGEKKTIGRRDGIIAIGTYNWIGNRTTITKGTKTPDYTIVGSGSLLNKNYTKTENSMIMLAGSPAKEIANDLRRIFSTKLENKIIKFFEDNPDAQYYQYQDTIEDDLSSIDYWFNKIM